MEFDIDLFRNLVMILENVYQKHASTKDLAEVMVRTRKKKMQKLPLYICSGIPEWIAFLRVLSENYQTYLQQENIPNSYGAPGSNNLFFHNWQNSPKVFGGISEGVP